MANPFVHAHVLRRGNRIRHEGQLMDVLNIIEDYPTPGHVTLQTRHNGGVEEVSFDNEVLVELVH